MDGIRQTTNSNIPAIVTSSGVALASNPYRISWAIQNLGTAVLYVNLGGTASATVFHFALKAGTGNDDGTGGSVAQEAGTIFTGPISVYSSGTRFTVLEQAP